MKNITPVSCLIFFFLSCQKDAIPTDNFSSDDSVRFTFEIGLRDMAKLRPDDTRTWEDMHFFYKNMVEKYKDHKEYNNIRHIALHMIIQQYHLLDDKSKTADEAISYYCEEVSTLKYINPIIINQILNRMQGVLPHPKIKSIALKCYQNNVKRFPYLGVVTPPENTAERELWEQMKALKSHF